jgi:hypothetical protein
MAIGRGKRAPGFTLPLTMALAFSLMALATAIVGMVLVSDKQSKAAASDLITRTSLESATEAALFDLEQNGEPQATEWTAERAVGAQGVTLVVADAAYKPDVNSGSVNEVTGAIADPGLRERMLAALTPPSGEHLRAPFMRFVDFAEAASASVAEEDCLRRWVTIGRNDPIAPAPPATNFAPPRQPLKVGAVIDVRAETRDWEGRWEVLWRRVRYTGRPELPWLTHDWRLLRLGHSDPDCPAPQAAAPAFTNALHAGP